MGVWRSAHIIEGLKQNPEIELIKTEMLSVAPVFPLLILSAWSKDGLTTLIRW